MVQGVREMCDVCETTLFNYHWACEKCGFVVCIDCYKARKYGEAKIWNQEADRDRDESFWLMCTNRAPHDQDRLMLTQIIAGKSLETLGQRIHTARALWGIPQQCGCKLSREEAPKLTNGICKELIKSLMKDDQNGNEQRDMSSSDSESKSSLSNVKKEITNVKKQPDDNSSALSWLADVALQNENQKKPIKQEPVDDTKKANAGDPTDILDFPDDCSESSSEGHSTLRDLLIGSGNKSTPNSPPDAQTNKKPAAQEATRVPKKSHQQLFEEIMADTLQQSKGKEKNENDDNLVSNQPRRGRYIPLRVMTMTTSKAEYPNVKHMWLCEGKLLRLLEPNDDKNNLKIFQEQWKRGQPVLVSEVNKHMDNEIWRPEAFSKDFGEDANDVVNCMTGALVPNQPMKRFWDGFDYINKRIRDDNGEPMLLKLKDWPPGEDFAETLPTRFTDLMTSLPLSDYTKRNGKFNLASRLPEGFVKPDLGPKMYNAYGSALHPTKGTTNLHLDISDAVNVMVYVGIPKDTGDDDSHIKEAYRAIDEAGCDILQRRRVREKNELPGALWHIYAPRDANKIRDLLNKVAIERGIRLEPNHDAIHDQSWYLDSELRKRLYTEYQVEGYPIAQCLGDAVFIPAGAPHQVRNLLNCIKVAEDFVSPENVSECFHLTHEFRALTDTHANHEDKLQIKNIIYHTVKDALATLSHRLGERIAEDQVKSLGLDVKKEVKEEPTDEEMPSADNRPSDDENNGGDDRPADDCNKDGDSYA